MHYVMPTEKAPMAQTSPYLPQAVTSPLSSILPKSRNASYLSFLFT
jgi:hypothetical protein